MSEQHRLPTGEWTADLEAYGKAWAELGKKLERCFPGYEATGFDPFVRMAEKNPVRDGCYFDLPATAALVLVAYAEAKDEELAKTIKSRNALRGALNRATRF